MTSFYENLKNGIVQYNNCGIMSIEEIPSPYPNIERIYERRRESERYIEPRDIQLSDRARKILEEAERSIEDWYIPMILFADPEIYQIERYRLFTRAWHFLAHESEIPNPGDYVVRYIEHNPIVVIRGEDGKIRAFYNICPHKGREFVKAEMGNTTHIRCPYHAFTYNTRGKLVGCPLAKEALGPLFSYEDFDMVRVKIESYNGFIFGILAPAKAPYKTLDEFLGEFKFYFDIFTKRSEAGLVFSHPQRWIMPANWKLPVDNFSTDTYHVPATHFSGGPWIIAANPLEFYYGYEIAAGRGYIGPVSRPATDMKGPQMYGRWWPELLEKAKKNLTPEQYKFWTTYGEVLHLHGAIFPNIGFLNITMPYSGKGGEEAQAPMMTLRLWRPISPTKTEFWNWFFIEKDAPEEFKKISYQAYNNTFTAGGIFESDDMENWMTMTHAGGSIIGNKLRLTARVGFHKPIEKIGPGKAQKTPSDMASIEFWKEYLKFMLGK